jgi:hypothetical protein
MRRIIEYVIGMLLEKMVATEIDRKAMDIHETMVVHYYYISKAIVR